MWTGGCGHVGDPMPPRTNIPTRITDLVALQRGSFLYAQFSVPTRTTEGIPIHTGLTFDLRAGPGVTPFALDQWLARAQKFPAVVQGGLVTYKIPTDPWVGKEVFLAARAIGANGKDAGWSNFAIVPVVSPPAVPQNLSAESVPQGAHLTWSGAPGDFRIYRRGPGEPAPSRMADVHEESWTDSTAEFGKPYAYAVQRIEKLEGGKEAESDPVEKTFTPVDTFPPAAPTGLHATIAPGSIEITWQQNTEPDLAGYRVYRAIGSGPFERIAQVSEIPSYSDHAVEAGKSYRYTVSAIDRSNNESDRSAEITVTMQ
jgi:hypothetical protein